jgi:hypothetical protein
LKLRNILIVLLSIVEGLLFTWFQKNVSSVVDSVSFNPFINIINELNGNGLTIGYFYPLFDMVIATLTLANWLSELKVIKR